MYSFLVDDLAGGFTSRLHAREHLDELLTAPFLVTDEEEFVLGGMTQREIDLAREEKLRATWGHDPESQKRWA